MKILVMVLVAMLFIAGCNSHQIQAIKTQPAPLIQTIKEQVQNQNTQNTVSGSLTLLDALKLALENNPQLSVFSLEVRAREAAALQASLWPNPEAEIEIENFAGSGPLSGFKSTETTISIGQLIELAGKRAKRTQLANLKAESASWNFESKKLEIYAQTVQFFNEVLIAQKEVALNNEILNLNQKFKEQVLFRIASGRISSAELARANVEVSRAKIALEQSKRRLQAARKRLAATWGATEASFDSVSGSLFILDSLPSFSQLYKALKNNPQLNRWDTEIKSKEVALKLASAGRIPDPVIRLGYRRLSEIDQQAIVAGIALPLPIFNRNQGAIEGARARLKQTALQKEAAYLQLQTELNSLYQELNAVHQAIQSLKKEILPQAQEAFQTISQGYKMGKFNFLEVLDARRSFFSARATYLQQLAEFQRLRTEIELLTGKSMTELN